MAGHILGCQHVDHVFHRAWQVVGSNGLIYEHTLWDLIHVAFKPADEFVAFLFCERWFEEGIT